MNRRGELQELIRQGRALLERDTAYYTKGARLALEDMIEQAEKALKSQGERAFSLCREFSPEPESDFWKEAQVQRKTCSQRSGRICDQRHGQTCDQECGQSSVPGYGQSYGQPADYEAVCFAMDRYTMVPSYFSLGKNCGKYGLAEAIAWYRKQDMRLEEEEPLHERAKRVLQESAEMLESAAMCMSRGTVSPDGAEAVTQKYAKDIELQIGTFDPDCAERLRENRGMLQEALAVFGNDKANQDSQDSKADKDSKNDKGNKDNNKEIHKDNLAAALVKCIDAFRDFRFSRILRSDMEEAPLYRMSRKTLEQIRKNIRENSFYRNQYEKIAKIARELSVENSAKALESMDGDTDYASLNRHFIIWGDTGRVVNFVTPPGTEGARLSFCLPGEENEEAGLGHIWVKGISLESASGPNAWIRNPDFVPDKSDSDSDAEEEVIPGWRIGKGSGDPVVGYDEKQEALYLCNPAPGDSALLTYDGVVEIKAETGYTLFFRAKQDGKFKKGLRVRLEFVNHREEVIGDFTYIYNRKSWLRAGNALSMQCSAILYAVEGDREQAVKAKQDLLFFLNDFCQGARHWMLYNKRPEGIDAYGAVQCGRILCSVASTYSLIREASVFSKEEKKRFYDMVDYLVRYCLDLRDRTELSPERVQRGSSNWQTDMCSGVAAIMMVLPDFPHRKSWLYNAQALLRGQLAVNINPDGSWPESLRYHFAALERFAGFVAAWKNETGEDWLTTTRFADMLAYPLHTVTPPYCYFDNKMGTPPFGDHELGGGKEFALFGTYLEMVAQQDKKLADRMYLLWRQVGFPVKGLWGESLAIETLLVADPWAYQTDPEAELRLTSDVKHTDSGILILRSGRILTERTGAEEKGTEKEGTEKEEAEEEGTEKEGRAKAGDPENYLAIMCAPKPIGHGHLDQGSFLLYHRDIPVVMDTGVEGYFNASTQWHLSSYSHACLQFQSERRTLSGQQGTSINLSAGNFSNRRGWEDVPRFSRLLCTETGGCRERVEMEIVNLAGFGIHHRSFLFDKETGELSIEDKIRDFTGQVLFSLPMVMREADIQGNRVMAKGYYGVDMEVIFHSPLESLALEKGRTTQLMPGEGNVSELVFVRAVAQAKDGFLVTLRPYRVIV